MKYGLGQQCYLHPTYRRAMAKGKIKLSCSTQNFNLVISYNIN